VFLECSGRLSGRWLMATLALGDDAVAATGGPLRGDVNFGLPPSRVPKHISWLQLILALTSVPAVRSMPSGHIYRPEMLDRRQWISLH
jgi:hypothetical protein